MSEIPNPRQRKRRTSNDSSHEYRTKLFAEDTASNPRQRRRRRTADPDPTVVSDDLMSEPEPSSSQNPEPLPDKTSSESEPTTSVSIAKLAMIDRIRTEILEDRHHCWQTEDEYWDESHNWADDGELASSEYWHFLGRYE